MSTTNPKKFHEPHVQRVMAPAVLRAKPASQYLGISESTFLRGVKSGRWPQPIQLSDDSVGWLLGELDKVLVKLAAERDTGAAA